MVNNITRVGRIRAPVAGWLLVLLLSAAALGVEPQPKALVLAWDDDGAAATALRDAGLDAVVPPKQTVGKIDLGDSRLVVLSADMALPDKLASQIVALVRGGGGLLVVHTAADKPNYWWDTYRRPIAGPPRLSPLWDVLPFVSVPIVEQDTRGIHNPFGPTRVLRQADSPLLAGVELTKAPAFPFHGFMVLPTHPLVQGSHLMFGWSDDQYKSPLWANGQVLAWGDDPEQRPLLLTAEYGGGRGAAAAVPLFHPAFLKWPGSKTIISNVTRWLLTGKGGQSPFVQSTLRAVPANGDCPPFPVPDTEIYGVGLPWIVQDSLGRMGLRVTSRAAGAVGAVVYDVPSAEQAQAVAALAKAGKPVVVANPAALQVTPLGELVAIKTASPPTATHAPAARDDSALPKQKIWGAGVWAIDSGNLGKAQAWFTDEGAARVKWLAELPDQNSKASPKPAVAADASKAVASWSKTYRWRLEGNLLDRQDLVEGWERPDYDDSAWAERPFGQEPPSPKLLGRQTPAQSLLAGAVWARAKLTLVDPQASRQWLVPSEEPKFVTLLDGKPLRQKVQMCTLTAGEHLVALRAWPLQRLDKSANYDPWGQSAVPLQWPSVVADSADAPAEPSLKGKLWYKAHVRLNAGSRWNAIEIEQPSTATLYVNGKRISSGASGLYYVPWRTGDNLLVWGNLDSSKISATQLAEMPIRPAAVSAPAAQRLSGIWYRRDDPVHEALAQDWPVALARGDARPAADWTPIVPVPEQGIVDAVFDERAHWFAAPFLLSASEAGGPARLVIDTTGGAVPTDLVKTIWVNGQPVQARIEFASTQRYSAEGGEEAMGSQPVKGVKQAKTVKPPKTDKKPRPGKKPKEGKKHTKGAEAGAGGEPAAGEKTTTGEDVMADDETAAALQPTVRGPNKSAAKQTTICFILSGRLKPGINWLAFPTDLQNVYGMRMAVPAGMGWTVPLPKLDFSGELDAVTWEPPFRRLDGAGLMRRGQLAAPPAGAVVLARFSDGAPAVARVGSITFATSDQSRDWSQWIEEEVRIDWTRAKEYKAAYGDPFGVQNVNHAAGNPVEADGAQVAASLLRGAPEILAAEPAGCPRPASGCPSGGSAVVALAPASEPRLLSYQLRNWEGMLLAEGRLAVPANAQRVTVPAPAGDPSPLTTRLRADRWLRVALLNSNGAAVRDYLETRIDSRPPVEVLLSPSDGLLRALPAAIPGAPNYDPRNVAWSLIEESPASSVVVPGERITLRVMCRNSTAQPQPVALNLAWQGALENQPAALGELRFTLAPYEQRTEVLPCGFRVSDMRFTMLTSSDAAPLRALPGGRQAAGDLATGRIVARAGDAVLGELPLIAVRPWKQFAPYSEHVGGEQGAPTGFGMMQFALTPSLESLTDLPEVWWNSVYGGNFFSALDWCRDHFVETRGNGGGFDGFRGTDDLAWGPYDEVWVQQGTAIDNAGYLPDGVQYQEYLYAGIGREYNRFTRGTQPLQMEVADYWASGPTSQREKNLTQFLRWRTAQGRPLAVHTASELKQLIKDDPAVYDNWRIFTRDAYMGWCQQFMAGLPPHSINKSQGETGHFGVARLHDDLTAFRSVLRSSNCAMLQPANLTRRGEMPYARVRAIDPSHLLVELTWHNTGPHAQTAKAVLTTPEFAQMEYLDYGMMAIRDDSDNPGRIRDDEGRIQPCVNLPPWFYGVRPIPLFTIVRKGAAFCFPADAMARDVACHVNVLIQPERVLGAYVMPSLERAAKNKLEGTTTDPGQSTGERQPEMVLACVLRNYGAIWDGMIASDRVDRLQPGEGAIYLMPSGAGDSEAKPMVDFVRNGGHVSLVFSTGGTKKEETALSELFQVKYAPPGTNPPRTMRLQPIGPEEPYLAPLYGEPQYVSTGQSGATDLIQAEGGLTGRVLLRTVEAGKGRAVFSSMNAGLSWGWDHDVARKLAQAVNWAAGNPVTLPDGVGGYAFEAKGMTFLVLEDLKYTGGPAEIHLKLPEGKYQAADLLSGQPVSVESSAEGVIVRPTLLPNGGSMVVVRKME